MKISAVNTYYPGLHINQINVQSPTFTHHKDYDDMRWKYGINPEGEYIINASSYFRRGRFYGSPIDSYQDVIDTFKYVFKDKKHPKKMLVVGVANSQEPFSYLASIKEIIGKKPLKNALDLHIVDLKSKPHNYEVYEASYFDNFYPPKFARSSFVKDDNIQQSYKVNDEICKYLTSTYNNELKSKWETRVQDASSQYPPESFDVISIHNVLPYIKDRNNQEGVDSTLENLYRALKPGGILIADPYHQEYSASSYIFDIMEEIYDGIYRKHQYWA